ncbi:O-antigen ligase family protein [Spirosoma foliorum]|uniref:O-antigen ligase family protein n=1 Tax=Spirosoma foliorum TaxID=2710596 RepID=A0A7G5H400_9BACT|nr:O-antigen ligase family protein [Spirosoma foliorum]QMW05842.1 O-antigen ligase family protein [Spirosoma foliorum]
MLINRQILVSLLLVCLLVALAFAIGEGQLIALGGIIAIPIVIACMAILIRFQSAGIYAAFAISFISIGLPRYIPGPLSLSVDILLVINLLCEFFRRFESKEWPNLRGNPVLIVILMWFVYCLMEIANPEARSLAAWFYDVRAVAFYLVLVVILGLEVINTEKDMNRFFVIWLSFSVVGVLHGMRQLFVGLDSAEKAWLNAGNASTHILHGQLRVFSFYSDAGQFGAAMGHAGLVGMILALGPLERKTRLWCAVVAVLCFYGMIISGTRGALFVPIAGIAAYLFLTRNVKVLVIGGLMAGLVLGTLKFTFIGQGNYQVQRMRSALDPNDPSLLVRLENQKKLRLYLASRPIGGGIGSAGYWGLRFSPNTVLAQTPTDSWYVKIWAQTGIIGLYLHLFMIGFWLVYFFIRIWRMSVGATRQKMMALYAGVVGIAVASYGNQIFGQLPTGIIIYLSVSYMYLFTRPSYEPAKPSSTLSETYALSSSGV